MQRPAMSKPATSLARSAWGCHTLLPELPSSIALVFLGSGECVDAEGHAAHGILVASADDHILRGNGIPPMDAAAFSHADVFGRGNLHVLPGGAQRRSESTSL